MDTIRWGIIGAGDVCEVKSGPGFQKANHSELVAVMRRDGDKARDFARRHGVPKWYDDADALINDPDVNAVYIATPPYAHKDYTIRAAAAGKPVYVEKPMALDHDACRAMIDACTLAGVPLYVAYYRRALPKFLAIKDLIDSGAIGEPRSVIVTHHRPDAPDLDPADPPWRYQPAISGGGIFVDMGSHMLDLLDFLLGPISTVEGSAGNQAGRYPAEDTVSAAFTFESGVRGVGNWCYCSAADVDRTEIHGSAGSIVFDTFAGGRFALTTPDGSETFDRPFPPHVQQPLIQTVVDALRGVGTCPSSGESAARTTRVIDRVLAGYRAARS